MTRPGYDPGQVDAYLRYQGSWVSMLAADRDAAMEQRRRLAEELGRCQAEVRTLRHRMGLLSRSPHGAAGVTMRIAGMLRLAHEEALEQRRQAGAQFEAVRAQARIELVRARQLGARRDEELATAAREREQVDAERVRADSEAASRRERADARAAAVRERADARAAVAREQADENFRIALAARRAESSVVLRREREESRRDAGRTLDDARAEADALLARARRASELARRQARDGLAEANRALGRLRTRPPWPHPTP